MTQERLSGDAIRLALSRLGIDQTVEPVHVGR
jgi:hypothetical protein